MPKNGHLTWKAIYQPGKVVAVGYKNGKRVLVETEETRIQLTCNADHLKDGTISVISYMIREFLYLLFIIMSINIQGGGLTAVPLKIGKSAQGYVFY